MIWLLQVIIWFLSAKNESEWFLLFSLSDIFIFLFFIYFFFFALFVYAIFSVRFTQIYYLVTKDSGREGPACRVISCRMERCMNYCVYAHLRQLIAISRHFWSVLKRSRHAASESHADMTDAAEFNMIVSKFLTWWQKAKTKQSKAKQSKAKQSKAKQSKAKQKKTKATQTKRNIC